VADANAEEIDRRLFRAMEAETVRWAESAVAGDRLIVSPAERDRIEEVLANAKCGPAVTLPDVATVVGYCPHRIDPETGEVYLVMVTDLTAPGI
jgi:hypothetical protein